MMCRTTFTLSLFLIACLGSLSCDITGSQGTGNPGSSTTIADYTVAKQAVLRAIPDSYINSARNKIKIWYVHSSHGTHVSYGVWGLPGFKAGDNAKFAVTNNKTDTSKLYFEDSYGRDLSTTGDSNWAAWRNIVRAYLDDSANADINVVMWSWCNIAGHNVPNYIGSMQTLIDEYGIGGSRIGSGPGMRASPVTFIFMTGHANGGTANLGPGNPKEQAKLIVDYCMDHAYYCIDYWSIDTHAMDDTYYEDANDDAVSVTYDAEPTTHGNNFYADWQASHTLGADWYENKDGIGGSTRCGEHNHQHITANRKAFAFWWVLARIAGY